MQKGGFSTATRIRVAALTMLKYIAFKDWETRQGSAAGLAKHGGMPDLGGDGSNSCLSHQRHLAVLISSKTSFSTRITCRSEFMHTLRVQLHLQ